MTERIISATTAPQSIEAYAVMVNGEIIVERLHPIGRVADATAQAKNFEKYYPDETAEVVKVRIERI